MVKKVEFLENELQNTKRENFQEEINKLMALIIELKFQKTLTDDLNEDLKDVIYKLSQDNQRLYDERSKLNDYIVSLRKAQ